MSYKRNKAPMEYDPDWLDREHEHIETAGLEELKLKVLHVEPEKPRDGWVVVADGSDWNPGSGAGAYLYLSGSWRLLG